mgnify:CR=1 FL=1
MKMWSMPEVEELNITATAGGSDKNHYEANPGHEITPEERKQYSEQGQLFFPDDKVVS